MDQDCRIGSECTFRLAGQCVWRTTRVKLSRVVAHVIDNAPVVVTNPLAVTGRFQSATRKDGCCP